ncbi:hypothetical protein Ddc_20663 [Ditylenchus destructor]|nr:hypothetical protein Ddc_20663 [Ditylenchus destructor]
MRQKWRTEKGFSCQASPSRAVIWLIQTIALGQILVNKCQFSALLLQPGRNEEIDRCWDMEREQRKHNDNNGTGRPAGMSGM